MPVDRMNATEWDGWLGGMADATEFILSDRFECDDGQTLARVLSTVGWPRYYEDRMYAKAGDNSNGALRRLQRKYDAAIRMLMAAHAEGRSCPIRNDRPSPPDDLEVWTFEDGVAVDNRPCISDDPTDQKGGRPDAR